MSCKDCVNRRDFLAKSALGVAALAVIEGCGDGQFGPGGASNVSLGAGLTVKVADFPGLATVGVPVDIGRQRAVVRTGANTFIGLSRVCTHEGCDTDIRNNRFECPCHDSIFTATGQVVRGPATSPLQTLAVTFDAATGTLTVS